MTLLMEKGLSQDNSGCAGHRADAPTVCGRGGRRPDSEGRGRDVGGAERRRYTRWRARKRAQEVQSGHSSTARGSPELDDTQMPVHKRAGRTLPVGLGAGDMGVSSS